MARKFIETLKNPKTILILTLSIIFLFLVMLYIDSSDNKSFPIEDKCGQFVNLLSHTIADEESCASRCRSQCVSIDLRFNKVKFTEGVNKCNDCICYCK